MPRHRVSPSVSPMTCSSGASSTPRLLGSFAKCSGILGRPVKCSVRGHSRHLFGDMTDTFSARQVDGGDLMGGEEDPVFIVQ
jgi:hypothetical protein